MFSDRNEAEGTSIPAERSTGQAPEALWRRWREWSVWALLAASWLCLFTYSAALNNPNERTRVLQARAILEQGRLRIGETFREQSGRIRVRDLYGRVYDGLFVNDVALVCREPNGSPPDCVGDLVPAKAPGTALLGLPALAIASLLGLVESGPEGEKAATWVLRYGGVAVWLFGCLLIFSRLLALCGLPPDRSRRVLLATGLGTGLFPYGIMFVGHALSSGALVVGIWLLIKARQSGRRRLVWAFLGGWVASFAVLLEYHAVIAVVCIAVWVVAMPERWKVVPGFVAGGLLVLAAYLGLHLSMYGSPWITGHFFLMSAHNRASQASGFIGLGFPHLGSLRDHLLDPYMGLLPLMPWLVVGGLVGVPLLLRGRGGALPAGAGRTLGAMVISYLLFVMCLEQWRTMNGWSIGPRYLVPATLPLALAAAVGWQRLGDWNPWADRVVTGLAAASVLMVSALTAVFPQPPAGLQNPFGELALPLLSEGYGVRNLGLAFGLGPASLVPFGMLVLTAVVVICLPARRPLNGFWGWARGATALLVASAWVVVLGSLRPTGAAERLQWQNFARRTGEGARPAAAAQSGVSLGPSLDSNGDRRRQLRCRNSSGREGATSGHRSRALSSGM